MSMVPFSLARLVVSALSDAQRVVLKEVGGDRFFAIDIGEFEIINIQRRVAGLDHGRPLTHDLLDNTIAAMGGTIQRVEITELRDHTFYANLVIDSPDGEIRIDARPSDALSLVAGGDVELMVDEERVLGAL